MNKLGIVLGIAAVTVIAGCTSKRSIAPARPERSMPSLASAARPTASAS